MYNDVTQWVAYSYTVYIYKLEALSGSLYRVWFSASLNQGKTIEDTDPSGATPQGLLESSQHSTELTAFPKSFTIFPDIHPFPGKL